jgi:hypothetical protein
VSRSRTGRSRPPLVLVRDAGRGDIPVQFTKRPRLRAGWSTMLSAQKALGMSSRLDTADPRVTVVEQGRRRAHGAAPSKPPGRLAARSSYAPYLLDWTETMLTLEFDLIASDWSPAGQ